MSERHINNHERQHTTENLAEHNERLGRLSHEKNEQAQQAEREHAGQLEKARRATEQHAEHGKQIEAEDSKSQLHTFGSHQLLKKDAYKQILKRTQKSLSGPARSFSKLVHNPTIESVSEITSKTAARPSGLLGGGIGAFLGSLGLVYTARHYGFTYNYSLFILLFVSGFVAGLVIEVLVKLALPKRR